MAQTGYVGGSSVLVSKGGVSVEVWILSTGVIKWFIGQHTFQTSVSSCLEKVCCGP